MRYRITATISALGRFGLKFAALGGWRDLYSSVFFHARVFHAGGRLRCADACWSDDSLIVPNDRNRRGLGRVRIGEMVKAAETRVHICEADRPTNGAGLEVGRIVVLG